MVPAWILRLNQKKCPTSCARSLQSSIMTLPPLHILCWLLNEYDFAKKLWRIYLQIYNFLLHCFTGEVLSFHIMVPAWILQLQQKNAQPLVQDPCKAEPFVARTETSIPRNVKWKGKLVGKSPFSNFSCIFLNPNNFFQFEF